MSEGCGKGIENGQKILSLEGWQKRQNGSLQAMEKAIANILVQIAGIHLEFAKLRLEMAQGVGKKPSWAVSLIITLLVSLVTGMGVYLLTRG